MVVKELRWKDRCWDDEKLYLPLSRSCIRWSPRRWNGCAYLPSFTILAWCSQIWKTLTTSQDRILKKKKTITHEIRRIITIFVFYWFLLKHYNMWSILGNWLVCEKNPLFSPIDRSIRRLNGASLAEFFRYTIVTQVNGVSYGGWILKEEEFEKTNFVKILQLT